MKHILFLAALWGFLEASLGWFFHLLHFPAGALMFPVGMILLLAGYSARPERSTVLLIGLMAACIKLSNLFLPGSEFVFKPVISILIEALLMAGIAPYIQVNWKQLRSIRLLCAEVSYGIALGMLGLAIGSQLIVNSF